MGAPLGHPEHHRLGPVQGPAPGTSRLRTAPPPSPEGCGSGSVLSLNPVDQVRLQVELEPDPPDRRLRQAVAPGHRGPRRVRRVPGQFLQRCGDDLLDLVQQDRRRPFRRFSSVSLARRCRTIRSRHPGHRMLGGPQLRGDRPVVHVVHAGQRDLRPQRMNLGGFRAAPSGSAGPARRSSAPALPSVGLAERRPRDRPLPRR